MGVRQFGIALFTVHTLLLSYCLHCTQDNETKGAGEFKVVYNDIQHWSNGTQRLYICGGM